MIQESKVCGICGLDKPKSEYATRKDKGHIYLKPYCKPCNMEYNRNLKRKQAAEKLANKPTLYCEVCSNVLPVGRKVYCSQKCRSKRQSNATYKNQQARGKLRKIAMIEKMGGKCSMCGYSKCLGAMEFHHVDPSTKEFGLDARRFSNTSQERLDIEAAKCIIVCSNCHAEIHWYKE